MMNETLRNDLNAELANICEQLENEINSTARLLVNDAKSVHLGHNLGNRAIEIARLNGRIETVQMLLRSA